ncbi:MAG: hypothetical protein AB1758_01550 [Candidatus Eremiobacterota bacterium]
MIATLPGPLWNCLGLTVRGELLLVEDRAVLAWDRRGERLAGVLEMPGRPAALVAGRFVVVDGPRCLVYDRDRPVAELPAPWREWTFLAPDLRTVARPAHGSLMLSVDGVPWRLGGFYPTGPDPVAFSVDGAWMGVADAKSLRLCHLPSRRTFKLARGSYSSVAFHPRLPWMAAAHSRGADLYDLAGMTRLARLLADQPPFVVAFGEGNDLVAADPRGGVWVWRLADTGALKRVVTLGPEWVDPAPLLGLGVHGSLAALWRGSGVRAWDLPSGQRVGLRLPRAAPAQRMEFSRSGRLLRWSGLGGAHAWDMENGGLLPWTVTPGLSPDRRWLCTPGLDCVELRRSEGELVASVPGRWWDWSPDGRLLGTWSLDEVFLHAWRGEDWQPLRRFPTDTRFVRFSRGGRWLLLQGPSRLRLVDPLEGGARELAGSVLASDPRDRYLLVSPDTRPIQPLVPGPHYLQIHDLREEAHHSLDLPDRAVTSEFSPASMLVLGLLDGSLYVWPGGAQAAPLAPPPLLRGAQAAPLAPPPGPSFLGRGELPIAAAFQHENLLAVSSGYPQGAITFWDLRLREPRATLRVLEGGSWWLTASDGRVDASPDLAGRLGLLTPGLWRQLKL